MGVDSPFVCTLQLHPSFLFWYKNKRFLHYFEHQEEKRDRFKENCNLPAVLKVSLASYCTPANPSYSVNCNGKNVKKSTNIRHCKRAVLLMQCWKVLVISRFLSPNVHPLKSVCRSSEPGWRWLGPGC